MTILNLNARDGVMARFGNHQRCRTRAALATSTICLCLFALLAGAHAATQTVELVADINQDFGKGATPCATKLLTVNFFATCKDSVQLSVHYGN